MRMKKVDEKIWYEEVDKFKKACEELGRQIKTTDLRNHFMGLKCWSWYPGNAPSELNISTFSDFIKYLGIGNTAKPAYRERITKDELISNIYTLREKLGRNIILPDLVQTIDNFDRTSVTKADVMHFFGSINNMNRELGFEETGTYRGHQYTQEELIESVKNFVKTQGFIPTAKYWDTHSKELGLPNRKTFNNKIGSWKKVLELCGFDEEISKQNYVLNKNGDYVLQHDNAYFLTNLILEYIEENNEVPTMRSIGKYYGTELKNYYNKHFGGWNNCLKFLGLELNSVSQYTDEELKKYFMDFVDEYGRVPTIQDFNKTGRPSFWVYQNRFGSWAEACIHYGFKPNQRRPEFYMEDGERCDSSYEYDISTWLKQNGIKYERDIPYVDFTNNYKGKMNCDYKIYTSDNQFWYVEMAGFIPSFSYNDLRSDEEIMYWRKLKYKIKLFKENNIENTLIIFPRDMKTKSLEEIFYFLNIAA